MNSEEKQIQAALDALYAMRLLAASIKEEQQSLIDAILTEEQKEKILEINSEYATRIEDANHTLSEAEDKVKITVKGMGKTIKSNNLQAVFTAGRVTWDSKGLQGYAAAVPELLKFQKVGEPTISIREVK